MAPQSRQEEGVHPLFLSVPELDHKCHANPNLDILLEDNRF